MHSMGRERKATGAFGERIAADFLKKRGYRIVGANVRTPFGEIDLVTKINNVTVFVEVKARLGTSLGPPYISVTKLKERHIIRNALFYLKRHGTYNSEWRIDVVSVRLSPAGAVEDVELITNAVQQDGW